MPDPVDFALAYDATLRRFDVAVQDGDLVLDRTPFTGMALSLLLDRRARADDVLPDAALDDAAPQSLMLRRGTPLDALDALGRRIGSRLWLLRRAKQTEQTRRLAVEAAQDALAWFTEQYGRAVTVDAAWLRAGVLGLVAVVGDTRLTVQRSLG